MVLLPVVGSALSARFAGSYVVEEQINDTNYCLNTPDRKRKKRVCHINMLKGYVDRYTNDSSTTPGPNRLSP